MAILRSILAVFVFALLAVPTAADAQPAERVHRVGILLTGQMRPEIARLVETLRAGLRDHGYVEGRNLTLDIRGAEGKIDRLPALATELIGLPVNVLVVSTMQAALAAKAATRTTPVVFIALADPVSAGLVASLARPGGSFTGLTWRAAPEQCAKWLELLKEAVPGASRVAMLLDPDPTEPACLAARESGARQLKLAYHQVTVRRPEDLARAFATIEGVRPDALYWCLSVREEPVLDSSR
jgi:putative ABC transport system substrate-binding protein